ncbi:hypothetical protein GCM10027036_15320 [Flavihumibacter cheonanensis]
MVGGCDSRQSTSDTNVVSLKAWYKSGIAEFWGFGNYCLFRKISTVRKDSYDGKKANFMKNPQHGRFHTHIFT